MTSQNIARRVIFTPYRKGMGPTFTLTLTDDHGYTGGKIRIGYKLVQIEGRKRTVLFEGTDFATPHASDSDATVDGIMGFLTLRPGDTDADFFADDSEIQSAYRAAHAERLAMEASFRFGQEHDEVEARRAARNEARKAQRARKAGEAAPATRTGIVRDVELCEDCMIVAVNGDTSGIDSEERVQAVEAGLTRLGHVSPNFDSETGEGYSEFSSRGCDCCRSKLAGSLYRFAVLGPVAVEPAPAPREIDLDSAGVQCLECGEDCKLTGRNTAYCPSCNVCPECGCPDADGFAHFPECGYLESEEEGAGEPAPAPSGESLFTVYDGAAYPHESETARGIRRLYTAGVDWVDVRAMTPAAAIRIAAAYDDSSARWTVSDAPLVATEPAPAPSAPWERSVSPRGVVAWVRTCERPFIDSRGTVRHVTSALRVIQEGDGWRADFSDSVAGAWAPWEPVTTVVYRNPYEATLVIEAWIASPAAR